jgi:hypothetical protein
MSGLFFFLVVFGDTEAVFLALSFDFGDLGSE